MKTPFTIGKIVREDGCWQGDIEPIVQHAIKLTAPHKIERGTFIRFSVYVDSEYLSAETPKQLRKILDGISLGAKCLVWRNAGKGATIDFR